METIQERGYVTDTGKSLVPTDINNVIRKEKSWNEKDKKNLHSKLRSEINEMTPQQRRWQLRQLIYEEKFKKVAKRHDGILSQEQNEDAIRLADQELSRVTRQNRIETTLHDKLLFKREWAAGETKKTWSDEDHDRVRRHMIWHLSQFHPDVHQAVLRGAIA